MNAAPLSALELTIAAVLARALVAELRVENAEPSRAANVDIDQSKPIPMQRRAG